MADSKRVLQKKTEPEIEFETDAWERFERAAKVVAKSPPQHREAPKPKRKRKASQPKKKPGK